MCVEQNCRRACASVLRSVGPATRLLAQWAACGVLATIALLWPTVPPLRRSLLYAVLPCGTNIYKSGHVECRQTVFVQAVCIGHIHVHVRCVLTPARTRVRAQVAATIGRVVERRPCLLTA
jgi:hypothetical protein